MNIRRTTLTAAGRARYVAAQGLRSAWYTAQMRLARRQSQGVVRPGEPPFEPGRGKPDMAALRRAYFDLFRQDRANIEAGLYPDPAVKELRLTALSGALKNARAFQKDVRAVDGRRVSRDGTEVRRSFPVNSNRYPDYYLQNFHYQSGGWFTDESAALYDTQVEALFSGTADAMRRAVMAAIARELKGKDQRGIRLLDVACGNGRFLRQVMEVWPKLQASGLDLSPAYTEAARERLRAWPRVEIVHDMAEAMPVESQSHDLVLSIYLFHELPPRVRPRVIEEMVRILKPGGLLIIADSLQFGDNPPIDGLLEYFPHGFHEPYYKSYLEWDLEGVLTDAGLIKEYGRNAFLTKLVAWRKPHG